MPASSALGSACQCFATLACCGIPGTSRPCLALGTARSSTSHAAAALSRHSPASPRSVRRHQTRLRSSPQLHRRRLPRQGGRPCGCSRVRVSGARGTTRCTRYWRRYSPPGRGTGKDRALASGVAVYDTLFVELAEREGIRLATFDAKVLKSFPKLAKRPSQLARGRESRCSSTRRAKSRPLSSPS